MTLDEFRFKMSSYRTTADSESRSLKDPYIALDNLRMLYEKLDSEERQMADQVLSEWVLSEDEGMRFDALALIDDFQIGTAVPALRELMERLYQVIDPARHTN
jgi:hypothetical protein